VTGISAIESDAFLLPCVWFHDTRNPIAGKRVEVRSNMAALEASIDKDFLRFKGSFFLGAGRFEIRQTIRQPGLMRSLDDPNFVGRPVFILERQWYSIDATGLGLVQPNSILPSLRSSKTQGRQTLSIPEFIFTTPASNVELTQRIKTVSMLTTCAYHRTERSSMCCFKNHIRHDIGWDYSLGVAYRPFLIKQCHDYVWRSSCRRSRLSRYFY